MKKFWKILIIAAVVLGVLAATCPGRQRHIDAEVKFMRRTLHELAERMMKDFEQIKEMGDKERQMMAGLEESLISQIEPAIKEVMVVKNYIFFSLGRYENETDGAMTASVGFLGMVFPNKKELNTYYNYNMNGSK
ncbi:MAG: DUF4359 domain-containing protein [Bacteroidaceae bacterium]|nr:DUF4359 domain-containing protein [Bacteroidaceae bacterium]MBP5646082.1 DUF4359 domain-containing protein [Bacteroidaceae bacterium]